MILLNNKTLPKITSETKLLGIIGYPIKHSLSPLLHTTLAQKYGLPYIYLAFEISPSMFKYVKNAIITLNIKGLNVTIPYKEKILPYLEKIDPLAKKIAAVNTVVNQNGVLIGYNTDIYGFIKSLQTEKINTKNKTVFVLGCGGVSKAIICGLKQLKVKKIFVYDIDETKIVQTKKLFGKIVHEVKKSEIECFLNKTDIFINATPLGMKETDPPCINLSWIKKGCIVYDVIYNRETELVKYAKSIGCKVITGLPMFVYQAEQSFFLWTGVKADTKFMFNLLHKLIFSAKG